METVSVNIAVALLEKAEFAVKRHKQCLTAVGTLNGQAVGAVIQILEGDRVSEDRIRHYCGE